MLLINISPHQHAGYRVRIIIQGNNLLFVLFQFGQILAVNRGFFGILIAFFILCVVLNSQPHACVKMIGAPA